MSGDLLTFIISTTVGTLAALIGIFGVIPQTIIVCKTKDTASLSLWMYILYVIGCIIWLIWCFGYLAMQIANLNNGFYEQDVELWTIIIYNLPTILLNSIGLITASIILFFKLKNIFIAKKLNISEHEAAKIKRGK